MAMSLVQGCAWKCPFCRGVQVDAIDVGVCMSLPAVQRCRQPFVRRDRVFPVAASPGSPETPGIRGSIFMAPYWIMLVRIT